MDTSPTKITNDLWTLLMWRSALTDKSCSYCRRGLERVTPSFSKLNILSSASNEDGGLFIDFLNLKKALSSRALCEHAQISDSRKFKFGLTELMDPQICNKHSFILGRLMTGFVWICLPNGQWKMEKIPIIPVSERFCLTAINVSWLLKLPNPYCMQRRLMT